MKTKTTTKTAMTYMDKPCRFTFKNNEQAQRCKGVRIFEIRRFGWNLRDILAAAQGDWSLYGHCESGIARPSFETIRRICGTARELREGNVWNAQQSATPLTHCVDHVLFGVTTEEVMKRRELTHRELSLIKTELGRLCGDVAEAVDGDSLVVAVKTENEDHVVKTLSKAFPAYAETLRENALYRPRGNGLIPIPTKLLLN